MLLTSTCRRGKPEPPPPPPPPPPEEDGDDYSLLDKIKEKLGRD